jgi:hypothetical protein
MLDPLVLELVERLDSDKLAELLVSQQNTINSLTTHAVTLRQRVDELEVGMHDLGAVNDQMNECCRAERNLVLDALAHAPAWRDAQVLRHDTIGHGLLLAIKSLRAVYPGAGLKFTKDLLEALPA